MSVTDWLLRVHDHWSSQWSARGLGLDQSMEVKGIDRAVLIRISYLSAKNQPFLSSFGTSLIYDA